ncbi:putative transmembrane protein [Rhodopirellula islandica]|uniref:Transmembrane protein n=1 Tax=Rhodopirellula islandica TaxID=595434 RepID=A0A0J1B404_RHOIS|nr:DUF2062 domain-containing protein [Rhodopirellula islandica]KLU01338.1 putative transmembrane protein [Rhodopirellula islandica]
MILFSIKLLSSLRKAIAGRKYPSQLAWGLAFGLLIGLIPHGNLLAVALVFGVLMLRVNHAMVALTAIGVTMVAPRLDPISEQLAQWFFDQEGVSQVMARAWDLPLVPWTDLNNTVVMGSFLIGLASLVPTFAVSYPLFKAVSGNGREDEDLEEELLVTPVRKRRSSETSTAHAVDPPHTQTRQPHFSPEPAFVSGSDEVIEANSGRVFDFRRVDDAEPVLAKITPGRDENANAKRALAVNEASTSDASYGKQTTHIEVLDADSNLQTASNTNTMASVSGGSRQPDPVTTNDDQHKIDEALSYLLRQLRDSQDKDAA